MVPKPIYETLPWLYGCGAVITLAMNDSPIRFFPVTLLIISALSVIYMRYHFRHLPPKEQKEHIAAKFSRREQRKLGLL